MKYKHVFLDFDDTIYDTKANAHEALEELYQHFGLADRFESFDVFAQLYWKRNHEVWSMYSRAEITRDELVVERFAYPFREVRKPITKEEALELNAWFLEKSSSKGKLVEGAKELLEYLNMKYKVHMLSNGFEEVQFRKMKQSGVEHLFEKVILSDHIGINKPDVRIFEYALSQVGAQPSEVIMIGDNFDTDIIGAINSKIDQIFYHSSPHTILSHQPTYRVTRLSEIQQIL